MVLAIFKDRKFTSWTPKNKVLDEVQELPMHLDERENCLLLCLDIDVDSLKSIIRDGSVDFGESDVNNKKRRQYQLLPESEKIKSARIELRQDSTILLDLQLTSDQCGCPN